MFARVQPFGVPRRHTKSQGYSTRYAQTMLAKESDLAQQLGCTQGKGLEGLINPESIFVSSSTNFICTYFKVLGSMVRGFQADGRSICL